MTTARQYDVNGYYEIARNPISKAGVFAYTKKSTKYPGWEADPTGIIQVYRPEEELSDPETLKSFRLTPWVDDHAMLGDPDIDPNLTRPEDKGVHGTLGEQIEYDPNDRTMYANLKLWSPSLADAIDAGKKDLSMGFRCVYEFIEGIFEGKPFQAIQRRIRGNHGASVPFGRMGSDVAVLDHFEFALDSSELEGKTMKTTRRAIIAAKLGCAPAALAAYIGMDKADATVLANWNTAMDAEEDAPAETSAAPVTLESVAEMMTEVAPAMAAITEAAAAMAGAAPVAVADPAVDDADMEPVVDAAGKAVMDEATGKQKMQKKVAAAVTDATPPALAAMDAAIAGAKLNVALIRRRIPKGTAEPVGLAAMDAAISKAELSAAGVRRRIASNGSGALAAMDARLTIAETALRTSNGGAGMKAAFAEIARRDALAKTASAFIGTFDASEMDEQAVAVYALDKLEIKDTPAEAAVATLKGYLHNRAPAATPTPAFGMDAAAAKPDASVAAYLSGGTKAA